MKGKHKIRVSALVEKDRDSVWKFYNDAAHIVHWNAASEDWHCPTCSNDLRVGGRLSARMEARDGSMGFDYTGVYDQVSPSENLGYRMPDGREVRVSMEDKGSSTQIVIDFDGDGQNDEEMQRAGWQAILDNFKKYAEGQA